MYEAVDNFMKNAYDIECTVLLVGMVCAMCAYIVTIYFDKDNDHNEEW